MSRHPRSDTWTDPRTPCDARSLVAALLVAAITPAALLAMTFPTAAAFVAVAVLAAALAAKYAIPAAARRMDGRTAAFRIPGLDTQVEVRLAPRPNR